MLKVNPLKICSPRAHGIILGVVKNSKTRALELKKKTAVLILEEPSKYIGTPTCCFQAHQRIDVATEIVHTRMVYDRFGDQITQKYGVVVENWPLKDFCNPSSVKSRIELETLYHAWNSGATRFRKLTPDEMTAWENERFQRSRLIITTVAPEPPNLVPPSPSILPPAPRLLMPTSSPTSPQPPVVLFTRRPVAINYHQHIPGSTLISNIDLQDPALRNIDPSPLAAGYQHWYTGGSTN